MQHFFVYFEVGALNHCEAVLKLQPRITSLRVLFKKSLDPSFVSRVDLFNVFIPQMFVSELLPADINLCMVWLKFGLDKKVKTLGKCQIIVTIFIFTAIER